MTPGRPEIRYRGGLFPANLPVVFGGDIHLAGGGTCYWHMPSKHLRTRRKDVRMIVLHHTAGEGNGTAVFKTLQKRGLSVHFTVDADGRVIQHADLDNVTFHAGGANDESIGIEIVNRGVAPALPKRGRIEVQATVHGHKMSMLRFTPEQVEMTDRLCRDLCAMFQLPFDVPRDDAGRFLYGLVNHYDMGMFRGVCGHFHVSRKKIDPVPHIFEDLFGVTR